MGKPASFDPGSADLAGIASRALRAGGSLGSSDFCPQRGYGGVLLGMFFAFAMTGSQLCHLFCRNGRTIVPILNFLRGARSSLITEVGEMAALSCGKISTEEVGLSLRDLHHSGLNPWPALWADRQTTIFIPEQVTHKKMYHFYT
jgi:hypothetical protein